MESVGNLNLLATGCGLGICLVNRGGGNGYIESLGKRIGSASCGNASRVRTGGNSCCWSIGIDVWECVIRVGWKNNGCCKCFVSGGLGGIGIVGG